MKTYKIAICPDGYAGKDIPREYDCSSDKWIESLHSKGFEVKIVDVRSPDLIASLKDIDAFMWRWAHLSNMRDIALRILPVIERDLGIPCFPDFNTYWHYDDKIAQAYLLQAKGIPIPKTWVWFDHEKLMAWAQQNTDYPLVLKLFNGAGSNNVKLINSSENLIDWIKKLFSEGVFDLSESLTYDYSKQKLNLEMRLRVAITALRKGKVYSSQKLKFNQNNSFHFHKGYLLIQEFLPDNDFDTRVTVIGNRAFAFRRFNRENDFRASGSGLIDFEPDKIDIRFVDLAFDVAKKLKMQSCAIDGLYSKGEPVICEVSYTFANWAVHKCPGHWLLSPDGKLNWVEGHNWPEIFQLDDFLKTI